MIAYHHVLQKLNYELFYCVFINVFPSTANYSSGFIAMLNGQSEHTDIEIPILITELLLHLSGNNAKIIT